MAKKVQKAEAGNPMTSNEGKARMGALLGRVPDEHKAGIQQLTTTLVNMGFNFNAVVTYLEQHVGDALALATNFTWQGLATFVAGLVTAVTS